MVCSLIDQVLTEPDGNIPSGIYSNNNHAGAIIIFIFSLEGGDFSMGAISRGHNNFKCCSWECIS